MKKIYSLIITLILGFILYYLCLPALNLRSIGFWVFLFIILAIYNTSALILGANFNKEGLKEIKFTAIFVIASIVIIIGYNFILSPIFNSRKYANRINIIENNEFVNDVPQVDFNSLPLVDKESSRKLGDRVMGQMQELVSQFYVSEMYTQINYKGNVIRVTPLEYDSIIKYFSNRKNGITGYISVDSVSGEAKLNRISKGMKYMPSSYFNENFYRKLRFTYPTFIFGNESFEIDEEGNPYFIVPTLKYKGVGIMKDVNGVVIFNPVDGTSTYYEVGEVPSWVDNVYKADVILEQVNDWGKYRGGYLNSIFGQKNVVATTEGYNYMALKDDVYLYTGITSLSSDESNIGFILTNMRTKETNFYSVGGAEEYSAMASSEGQVQQMGYTSTFPLLINLNNRPTYLMSLKDNAGLVKMYSFVDVSDYQKVSVSDSSIGIREASRAYLSKFGNTVNKDKLINKKIKIKSINTFIINGNSVFYITDEEGLKYSVEININSELLPFIKTGDNVSIGYVEQTEVTKVLEIK